MNIFLTISERQWLLASKVVWGVWLQTSTCWWTSPAAESSMSSTTRRPSGLGVVREEHADRGARRAAGLLRHAPTSTLWVGGTRDTACTCLVTSQAGQVGNRRRWRWERLRPAGYDRAYHHQGVDSQNRRHQQMQYLTGVPTSAVGGDSYKKKPAVMTSIYSRATTKAHRNLIFLHH